MGGLHSSSIDARFTPPTSCPPPSIERCVAARSLRSQSIDARPCHPAPPSVGMLDFRWTRAAVEIGSPQSSQRLRTTRHFPTRGVHAGDLWLSARSNVGRYASTTGTLANSAMISKEDGGHHLRHTRHLGLLTSGFVSANHMQVVPISCGFLRSCRRRAALRDRPQTAHPTAQQHRRRYRNRP